MELEYRKEYEAELRVAEGRMSDHYEARCNSMEKRYHGEEEELQGYVLEEMNESRVAPENRDEILAYQAQHKEAEEKLKTLSYDRMRSKSIAIFHKEEALRLRK